MSYFWTKTTNKHFPAYTTTANHFGNVARVTLTRFQWKDQADTYILAVVDRVANCCFDILFPAGNVGAAVSKANTQLRRWNVTPGQKS
jgi:hypothetical protein